VLRLRRAQRQQVTPVPVYLGTRSGGLMVVW